MNTRMRAGAAAVMLALTLMSTAGAAQTAVNEEKDTTYWSSAVRKLKRGASNTAFGIAELPAGIREIGQKHGVGAAATWGVLHGTGRAIQRTAVGIFEILTFPLGLPQGFEPIIEPEYMIGGDETADKESR